MQRPQGTRTRSWSARASLCAAVFIISGVLIVAVKWTLNYYQSATDGRLASASHTTDQVGDPPPYHKPLRRMVDFPGVTEPRMIGADASKLADAARVIGVVIDGQAYAFARDALMNPRRHIVNLMIDETPLSVTYCDLVDCTRVLTHHDGAGPIDLHVGGLDVDDQMVFLLDGVRYGQSSPDLPLEDYPFEKTCFGKWKARHPESLIYEG